MLSAVGGRGILREMRRPILVPRKPARAENFVRIAIERKIPVELAVRIGLLSSADPLAKETRRGT